MFSRRSFFRLSDRGLKIKPFSASYTGYERDISSISLIVDDRLWFRSVIQTGVSCLFPTNFNYVDVFLFCFGARDIVVMQSVRKFRA